MESALFAMMLTPLVKVGVFVPRFVVQTRQVFCHLLLFSEFFFWTTRYCGDKSNSKKQQQHAALHARDSNFAKKSFEPE
jgi:hypothetical protein